MRWFRSPITLALVVLLAVGAATYAAVAMVGGDDEPDALPAAAQETREDGVTRGEDVERGVGLVGCANRETGDLRVANAEEGCKEEETSVPLGGGSGLPVEGCEQGDVATWNGAAWVCDQAVGRPGPNSVTGAEVVDGSLTSADIGDGEVKSADIGDGQVKSVDIGDGQVTTADLGPNSVTSAKIKDGSVANPDLASNAVTTDKIKDETITSADLATGSVKSDEIADETITAADLGTSSVGSDELTDESVTADDLATDSVGTAEIADDTVTADDLATDSVGTSEIEDGSIKSPDIGDGEVHNEDLGGDAVTTDKIADGTITRADLAPDALQSDLGVSSVVVDGGFPISGSTYFDNVASLTIDVPQGPNQTPHYVLITGQSLLTCNCTNTQRATIEWYIQGPPTQSYSYSNQESPRYQEELSMHRRAAVAPLAFVMIAKPGSNSFDVLMRRVSGTTTDAENIAFSAIDLGPA